MNYEISKFYFRKPFHSEIKKETTFLWFYCHVKLIKLKQFQQLHHVVPTPISRWPRSVTIYVFLLYYVSSDSQTSCPLAIYNGGSRPESRRRSFCLKNCILSWEGGGGTQVRRTAAVAHHPPAAPALHLRGHWRPAGCRSFVGGA